MERRAKDGTVYQKVGDDSWTPVTRTAKDGTVYKKIGNDSWTPLAQQSEPVEEKPWYDVSAKGLARGAIDAIPAVAAAGGGALGMMGGGPLAAVGAGSLAYAGGKELSDILKNRVLGDEATSTKPIDQAKRVAGNLMDGASMEMSGQIVGAALDAAKSAKNSAGKYLKKQAEKAAVNATGATGTQASKFEENAGRELLDKKLVRFGDTPETVAGRTQEAMDHAANEIDTALKELDKQGVVVNQDNIVAKLNQKIEQLRGDASQAGTLRKLESVVDDIMNTGRSTMPVSEGEQVKRGFRKAAGNWMDPDAGAASKKAYLEYMNEVERAAESNPELRAKFKAGKDTYGLLAPIEEAASKRAMTTSQSPLGGFMDTAAVVGGMAGGGAPGAVIAPVARRVIAPRASSSIAVTADKLGNMLLNKPAVAGLSKTNPRIFSAIAGSLARQAEPVAAKAAETPPKGKDKWAREGYEKVVDHSPEDDKKTFEDAKDAMLSNPKIKDLLAIASDLKPGSKAMNSVVTKIKAQIAKGS